MMPTCESFVDAGELLGPVVEALLDHFAGTEINRPAIQSRCFLVRTGKFREDALAASEHKPDAVLDSIADLPAWLAEAA